MKLVREIHFNIKQEVYRKCDPDAEKYIVTGYIVDATDVLYSITGMLGKFTVYHFEIADFRERLAILN